MSLDSYDVHIGSAVHLINLCLHSKPATTRFFFCSSVSTCARAPESTVGETYPAGAASVAATGYARSKWVVEEICERLPAVVGVRVRPMVFRLGQLVGDTEQYVFSFS